eukprot:COSAG02_NODE_262_length_26647_cov_21.607240_16_plen_652_part_00
MAEAGGSAVDRWGRGRDHPDFERDPPLKDLLTQGLGDADWWLVDDTLCHVFVSAALRVDSPKPTVVYEILSHSDRRRCFVVIRRFSDFVTLAADMRKELFFLEEFVELLPEVPSTFLSFLTTDTDPESRFVLERKQALECYLKELMGVGALHKSRSFRRFMLDRVYAHGWEQPSTELELRSGVAIHASDFRAASQQADGCADPTSVSGKPAGASPKQHMHVDEFPTDSSTAADSVGQSREGKRISEDALQLRRDEEERRLAGLRSAQQPQPQPEGKSSRGTPFTISEGDPTSAASQRRRADRAAERERHQKKKEREREKEAEAERDAQRVWEAEKEKQTAKDKKLRRQQRKEAKAARQRAKDVLTNAAPLAAPHVMPGVDDGTEQGPEPEQEAQPEPEPELEPEHEPRPQPELRPAPASQLQAETATVTEIGKATARAALSPTTFADPAPSSGKEAELEWEEKIDADTGRPYYINVRLNKSSWEKPTLDPSIIARQEARLQEHRRAGQAAAAVEEASIAVDAAVNTAVEEWCSKPWPKGLRALLSTLPEIWPPAAAVTTGTGDTPTFHVGLVDRQAFDDAAIRRVYHKAIRLVHPDKLKGKVSMATVENANSNSISAADLELVKQHVLAQKLFAVLSEGWAEFQKEVAVSS